MKRGIKWGALRVVVLIAAGMMPQAVALTEGSKQQALMRQAVIGGVLTSLPLTLVVVPVTYCCMDDLAQWFKRKFSGKSPVAGDDLRQEGEAHAV